MVISWSNSSKIYFFHLATQLIRLTLLSDQNVKNLKIISLSSCHVLFYSHKNSIWSSSSMRTSSRIRFMQQYQRLLSKNILHRVGIRMELYILIASKIYIDIQNIQKCLSYNNHIHPLLPNDFHTYRYFIKFELNWLAQRWCSLKWDNGVFTKLKAGVHMLTKHAKQ